jgi:hypothetical protein
MYLDMNIFRILHHYLVPHEANNHRAKALHHEALLAYILILGIFNLGIKFFHKQAPDVLGYATDIRVEQLLADTNTQRAQAGLSQLSLNGTLSQAAAAKAADMLANNYWAHNSPGGKTPWDFIIGSGYQYTLAGENLAKNFQTSTGVVDAWMASPSHRANVLKSGYQDVGFAVVNGVLNGEETTLVVQMFGTTSVKPVAQIPQVQAAAPEPVKSSRVGPAKTVVPKEPAAQVTQAPVPTPVLQPVTEPAFTLQSIKTTPIINISGLTHEVSYVFVGLLIGVLAVDAYVVSRRRVVRLVGHNIAHILFLATILGSGLSLIHGSLI